MVKIDSETAKKVMDILSNPEMMSKISAIASGIAPKAPETAQPPPAESAPASFVSDVQSSFGGTGSNSKADLLLAIKPFLKANKQSKIDAVIKALTVATAVSKIKGGGIKNV